MYLAYFLTSLLIVLIIEELVRHSRTKSHEAATDYSGNFAVKTATNNPQITTTAVTVAEEKDPYIFDFSKENREYLQSLLFQSNSVIPWRKVTSNIEDTLGLIFPWLVSKTTKAEEESLKLRIEIDESQLWTSLKETIQESAFNYKGYPNDRNKPFNYFTHRKREKVDSSTDPYFYYPYKQDAWDCGNELHTTVYIPVSKICSEQTQSNIWKAINSVRKSDNLDHDNLVYFITVNFKGFEKDVKTPNAHIRISTGIGCLGRTIYNRYEHIEVIRPMVEELIWTKEEPHYRAYKIQDVVKAFTSDIPAALHDLTDLKNASERATKEINYLLENRNSADYETQKYCREAFKIWSSGEEAV